LFAVFAARKPLIFSKEVHMSAQVESPTTFAVSGGIFGVSRLATRLNALVASGQIGEWHIGHWTDWQHTAIRIKFATAADAALAKASCAEG
jgi:hypothetical protein